MKDQILEAIKKYKIQLQNLEIERNFLEQQNEDLKECLETYYNNEQIDQTTINAERLLGF